MLDRAVLCNENGVPADPTLIPGAISDKYIGGDFVHANANVLGSGAHCATWPVQKPIMKPSGDKLATPPLMLGYESDSATTGPGNYALQRYMGGKLLTLEGSSHGVLVNNPDVFAKQITEYMG